MGTLVKKYWDYSFVDASLYLKAAQASYAVITLNEAGQEQPIDVLLDTKREFSNPDYVSFAASKDISGFTFLEIDNAGASATDDSTLLKFVNSNVKLSIGDVFLNGETDKTISFDIKFYTRDVKKLDHIYYETPDWNANDLEEGYILNKPFENQQYTNVLLWEKNEPTVTYDDSLASWDINETITGTELNNNYIVDYVKAVHSAKVENSDYSITDTYLVLTTATDEFTVHMQLVEVSLSLKSITYIATLNNAQLTVTLNFENEASIKISIKDTGDTDLSNFVEALQDGSVSLFGSWAYLKRIPLDYLPIEVNNIIEESLSIPLVINVKNNINTKVSDIEAAIADGRAILAVKNGMTYTLHHGSSEVGEHWEFCCGQETYALLVQENENDGLLYLVEVEER